MSELRRIADVIGPDVRLLVVGVNPGLRSAQTGRHFAGPGNRFWPALHRAGVTGRLLTPAEQWLLVPLGVGITNLVERPTARASELSRTELRQGALALADRVARWRPRVVAILGLGAYRIAFDQPRASPGRRPDRLAGATVWLLPNPSGLNAATTVAEHAEGLAAAARAASAPARLT